MKIEEYLNKKDLDIHEPELEAIWQGIASKSSKKKSTRTRWISWMAASIMVLITVGSLIRHEIVIKKELAGLAAINEQLGQQENQYVEQVNLKWNQYSNIRGNSTDMEPWLMQELIRLDTIYQNALNDLKIAYNERAIQTVLDTYEKRLQIIEQLINEKQKQRNYEIKNTTVEI